MLTVANLETKLPHQDTLASLPLEIVYCLFEACEPSILISLALTNKNYLLLLSTWLDKRRTLASKGTDHEITPGTQFRFLCQEVGQVKDRIARKEAAAILRDWQTKLLTIQGELNGQELTDWNVCNGCLRFKKQHKVSCKRCSAATCQYFICNRYCLFY